MILRVRRCGRPPREVPEEEVERASLPPVESVLARLGAVVGDESVRRFLGDLVEAIYSLPDGHEFKRWLRYNIVRYRLERRPERKVDFILSSTLAFVDYCSRQGGGMKALIKAGERLEPPQCRLVALLFHETRAAMLGASKREATRFVLAWKRETDKIVRLWREVEREWCRW